MAARAPVRSPRPARTSARLRAEAAIVDGSGRLVKVYTGNDWTPDQVLADLKATGIGG